MRISRRPQSAVTALTMRPNKVNKCTALAIDEKSPP
jgi:hypothetical protein